MNPILKYKEDNNLSYRELADRCKVDSAKLLRLIRGDINIKNITLETAIKISDAIGIENPKDLLRDA